MELPEAGDSIEAGESCVTIEAVKAVEEIKSPVSGEIVDVNEALEDTPETINKSAFDDGWLMQIKMSNPEELDAFLSAEEYQAFIEE